MTTTDEDLLDFLRRRLAETRVQVPTWRESDPGVHRRFVDQVRHLLLDYPHPVDDAQVRWAAEALTGVGLLQRFLREPDVEEIYVRGNKVAVERGGVLKRLGPMATEAYWADLIRRVADLSGQALNPLRPAVLVDLPGGERFTGMLPPMMDAPAINIRCFGRKRWTLDDLIAAGSLPQREADFLRQTAATLAGNVLIAGEFSSGKTTLLNALLDHIPARKPVAVLETFREVQVADHLYAMRAVAYSEPPPGQEKAATMEWVLNVVYTRTNPAAIVLGEIVSPGEALQFLKAANLGRKAFATIHGASVEAALHRLEVLALGAMPEIGLQAVREMVAAGIDLVAFLKRVEVETPEGTVVRRVVSRLTWLANLTPNGNYELVDLYLNPAGREINLAQLYERAGEIS